jgi:tetratricopeptide (TPR) repeat protein
MLKTNRGLVILVIATLTACSSAPQKPRPPSSSSVAKPPVGARTADLAAYQAAWAEVGRLEKENQREAAAAAVARQILRDDFETLPEGVQYQWLHHAAALASEAGAYKVAHPLFKLTSQMSMATDDDWGNRFIAAQVVGERADAMHALTVTARRWPQKLESLDPRLINRTLFGADARTDTSDARFQLLQALYAAQWKIDYGLEPSEAWADFARLLLERGDLQRAIAVSERITSPRVLLALRVDKRFDPVVRAAPARFDIDKAVVEQLTTLERLSAASPRELALKYELIYACLEAAQAERALHLADAVLNDKSRESAYDDYDDQINWILDARADALRRLGRWREAQRYYEQAAARQEHGGPNVSNAINLGGLHAEFGRSREALAALGGMVFDDEGVSEYGGMQIHHVMLLAALASRDTAGKEDALEFMRDHQSAALSTYQAALVDANELEQAASLLIRRLQDPALRGEALAEMQEYHEGAQSPVVRTHDRRWREIKARRDVRTALAAVGRIEKFSLAPEAH